MGYGPIDEEAFDVGGDFGNGDEVTGKGLFITNEGQFHVRQCVALVL